MANAGDKGELLPVPVVSPPARPCGLDATSAQAHGWLNLQMNHDLEIASREVAEKMEHIRPRAV